MPKLNARGEWCAGVGGGIASWQGGILAYSAGGTSWVDDDWIVYQACVGDECHLLKTHVRTGEVRDASSRGANKIAAGGGVWAAWLGSVRGEPPYGLYTSSGLYLRDAWLGGFGSSAGGGGVGPDGSVAVKDQYQAAGGWSVWPLSGRPWVLTRGDADDIQLLGDGNACWRERGEPRTSGTVPRPLVLTRPFWWLRMVQAEGEWWVLYQDAADRLVLHPWDSHEGYVVARGNTFAPDVVFTDGAFRLVWATREGEDPESVQTTQIQPSERRLDLGSSAPTPPPPPPPPPDPDEPEPTAMTMEMPREIYETWKAVADRFRTLHDGSDDDRREATARGVATIRARHRGTGPLDGRRWVWKTEHSNLSSPSKDTIAFVPDGPITEGRLAPMFMFDMISGSTRETNPHPIVAHNQEDGNEEAYILVVEPHDWLADTDMPDEPDTPDEPETPSPTPAPDVAALKRDIAELRGRFDALAQVVSDVSHHALTYGSKIGLRTDNGHTLSAEGGGGGNVRADRTWVKGWETFTIERPE